MWGRLVTCGRLPIGLPKLSRNQQQADFQSAAGCHPAPQTNVCNWLNKIVAVRKKQRFSNTDDAFCRPRTPLNGRPQKTMACPTVQAIHFDRNVA
jgi:hypothetical protein